MSGLKTFDPTYEVIIVGGSFAGLSAALTLGRSLREVLIIDASNPCNAASPLAHNLIGHEGQAPMEILENMRQQVLAYESVTYMRGLVQGISGHEDEFEVATDSGLSFTCRKILLASGVIDILPEIDGLSDCWGKSAIHCPYCHGYELKGKKIGILSHGQAALDMALLIGQWCPQVTVLSNTHDDIGFDQRRILKERGIALIESEISAVEQQSGNLTAVCFSDGTREPFEALYLRPGVTQSRLILDLGVALNDHGFIESDHAERTSIPGIYAAGDCSNMSRSLAQAIGAGNRAGMCINHDLLVEPESVATNSNLIQNTTYHD